MGSAELSLAWAGKLAHVLLEVSESLVRFLLGEREGENQCQWSPTTLTYGCPRPAEQIEVGGLVFKSAADLLHLGMPCSCVVLPISGRMGEGKALTSL